MFFFVTKIIQKCFFPEKILFEKEFFPKKFKPDVFFKKKFSKKFPKNYSGALGEYWGALGGTREAGTWGYSGALREYLGVLWALGEFLGVLGGTCFSNNVFSKNYENYFFSETFSFQKTFFSKEQHF